MENDEGIFKCVEREVFEETNLRVKPKKIAYLEELIDEETYICKIWVICSIIGGELCLCNLEAKENFLKNAQFFSIVELKKIKVYPEFIKTILLEDYKEGFPQIKYVGFHKDNIGELPPNNC